MKTHEIANHITEWLIKYCDSAKSSGFIVGISGGVDSALASTLCAMTGRKVILVTLPIRQVSAEYKRAKAHLEDLQQRYQNVSSYDIDLSIAFTQLEKAMPFNVNEEPLSMANSRARLRMTALYAIGQVNNCLVVGTGNKIEDFGVGFFTKYGDGGVDISPIADLTKTEVWTIAKEVGVIEDIVSAVPTDGLWENGSSDEEQLGASYPELEWAMSFSGDESTLSDRELDVLGIFRTLNQKNQHKMLPIPVCKIPINLL